MHQAHKERWSAISAANRGRALSLDFTNDVYQDPTYYCTLLFLLKYSYYCTRSFSLISSTYKYAETRYLDRYEFSNHMEKKRKSKKKDKTHIKHHECILLLPLLCVGRLRSIASLSSVLFYPRTIRTAQTLTSSPSTPIQPFCASVRIWCNSG